jgi:hypothetical protein
VFAIGIAKPRVPMALMSLWWDTVKGIATTAPRDLDLLRADIRCALRNLRRNPGFTAVAALSLAIGIGANAAVFSIVNGVLITALPYEDPARLLVIFEKVPFAPVDKFDFSAPDFEIMREAARSYSGMAAFRNASYELSGVASPERLDAARVSPELFSVLGTPALVGRTLSAEDDRQNANRGIDARPVDTRVRPRPVGRRPHHPSTACRTVVGVMPASFGSAAQIREQR